MPTSTQEAQWVLRPQCGDREALELLLRSVQPWLHRYLNGLVGGLYADDVMQEVLILVCRNLAALHTPELFRPMGLSDRQPRGAASPEKREQETGAAVD